MSSTPFRALALVILMSGICAFGDYCLKRASEENNSYWNRWLLAGTILGASTNLAWVFVMKHMKLATLGAVFSLSLTLMLAGVGFVAFHERMSFREVLGMVLAVTSLLLLGRFSD